MDEILIEGPEQALRGVLGVPTSRGPWPAVVVLHDALGLTADSRRQVQWLAHNGFLAVAPDLYSRGRRPACLRTVMRCLQSRRGSVFDDIDAARRFLIERPDCTGMVGVIGFCLGGGFALLAATGRGFDVASVNYGPVPTDAADVLAGACPVVGSFGAKDYTMTDGAGRLASALTINGVEHDVTEYPRVGHGFLNSHDGVVGWIMARIAMGFDDAAAEDARHRIVAFFDDQLR